MRPYKDMIQHDIEELLSDLEVFFFFFSGQPAHMDSYMTVIDFGALRTALKKNTFSRKDWDKAVEYWELHGYLSPTIKLLASTMKRLLDNPVWIKFPQEI